MLLFEPIMEAFEIIIETETYYHCKSSSPVHIKNTYKEKKLRIQEAKSFIPNYSTAFIHNSPMIEKSKTSKQEVKSLILNELINKTDLYLCNISDISDFYLDSSIEEN